MTGARRNRLRRDLYRTATVLAVLAAALAVSACTGAGSGFMQPAGPVSSTERSMFFEIATITLIVVIPVFLIAPYLLWRFRRSRGDPDYAPDWESSAPLEWLIWGIPVLIVIALAFFVWIRTDQLDPYRPIPGTGRPVKIQVVALDWKWLFIYPGEGVASVNEMAIPSGRPVELKLTSATVMQSFHVPRLAGQIYVMAGMTTSLGLRAEQNGTFRGRNTQYNGEGFARQRFTVKALPASAFEHWIDQARKHGRALDKSAFLQLAKPSTPASPSFYGRVEPNMFRRILALSTRPNHPLGAIPRHRPAGQQP